MKKTLNFEKYEQAGLAARLARSKEDALYTSGALQALARDLNLGPEAEGFVEGTYASKEGIETATNVYNQKFEEERGKYKPIDLAKWYDSVLTGLEDTEKTKILTALGKHDETIKDILEKTREALHILNYEASKDKDLFTPEQRSEAKETIEKYNSVLDIIETLDKYKFEKLRPDAVEATRKRSLEDLVKKL